MDLVDRLMEVGVDPVVAAVETRVEATVVVVLTMEPNSHINLAVAVVVISTVDRVAHLREAAELGSNGRSTATCAETICSPSVNSSRITNSKGDRTRR
jgi:hypothetical protein